MQTIKVFLGSSIDELREERLFLSDYLLNSVRPIFKRDGVDIEVVKCEDIRTGYKGKSSQEEINDLLKGCDISVFMFKTKAGPQTVREYNVAQELVGTKKHEIYVYCFGVSEEEKEESLKDFKQQMRQIELYWKTCKDVADLESQFVIGLLDYERQLLGKTKPSAFEQENDMEKDGDTLFADFMQDEEKRAQRKEKIHQNIEDLLQQTETVMADEDETIAARIFKVIELYKKADQWAAATDYEKDKYSHLLFDYASFLNQYGLYHDAETVYLHQIELAKELYGKEHKNTATSYNDISTVYLEQANYKKALEYCQKAIVISEKVLGADHPETAIVYNNIGSMYVALGKCKKALKYYGKALAINEEKLGKKHLNTAICYNNIGEIYYKQGDYNKALKYYQKALAIDKEKLGTDNPGTATDYNNIGTVYRKQGKYDMALEYHLKAMEIRKNVLGEKHPDTAYSYNNIGWVFREQTDYDKALNYYDKAYQILKNIFGDKHPKTKDVLESINYVKKALENEKKHSL